MATVPSQIGRYQIVELIGHGGVGALYLARDPALDRLAAITLLHESFDNQELRDRFVRQARSVARLQHPNIITTYELGEHEGQPFIATEYIHGETLAGMIERREPMVVQRKLQIVGDICSGLEYAHKSGIVHRNIKPANVVIDAGGTPKILNFDIALVTQSGTTKAGMLVGTPNYMSPEQIRGEPIDGRADIFAAGAILYELIASRPAFVGRDLGAVLNAVLERDPVPVESLVPGLDPDVRRIVDRALAKAPDARYSSAAGMRADLERLRQRLIRLGGDAVTSAGPPAAIPMEASPGPPPRAGTVASRRSVDRESLAKRRAAQIDEYVKAARGAFEAADYDAVVDACERAFLLDPEDMRARELMDRARMELEEREIRLARDLGAARRAEAERFEAKREEAERKDAERKDAERAEAERQAETGHLEYVTGSAPPSAARSAKEPTSTPAPTTAIRKRPGLFSRVLDGVREAAGAVAAAIKTRAPVAPRPEPVLFGASAPRAISSGSTFTARFVVYIKERERAVTQRLRDLSGGTTQPIMGLTPERGGRWKIGTPVTVRVTGPWFTFEPPERSFEWSGSENILTFSVRTANDARGIAPLTFHVFIEGIPVATVTMDLELKLTTADTKPATATGRAPSTAFASYSAKDTALVTLCLSALHRWDPHLQVFIDCLDLTPNEKWQAELERVIPEKDAFLLFWSINAMRSRWVQWEIQTRKLSKGVDSILPMPLEDPDIAPPPPDLSQSHFRDRFLVARHAALWVSQQKAPSGGDRR